jgi:hypothetical protein
MFLVAPLEVRLQSQKVWVAETTLLSVWLCKVVPLKGRVFMLLKTRPSQGCLEVLENEHYHEHYAEIAQNLTPKLV